ncbi:PIG-L family deacetylase [soil metagenome]
MSDQQLEVVPEDWTRALCVVAHPDDLEYGTASAIARWTEQGKEIAYCLVTSGEAGIDTLAPDECARVRQDEERRSAAVVGVDTVEFLAHPDGLVEASLALRRDLAVAIRRHRPEVVVSINFHPSWGGASFNHADHRNTGLALLDAVRDAANRWIFVGAGGDRWDGVRLALFSGSSQATHAVDVTNTLDRGIASLREHAAYLDALDPGSTEDPTAFLRQWAEAAGPSLGVGAAAPFEVIRL